MKCIESCIKRNVNWFDPNIRSEGIFEKNPKSETLVYKNGMAYVNIRW